MFSCAIPNRTILVGLMTFCGLVTAVSQEPPSENATKGAQSSTHPITADLPHNNASQGSIGRGNPLWSISLATLTATRERPIFSASRRPPPVEVKVSPTQAPSAVQPMLALVGAIAGETEGIAIFLDGTTKDIIRLRTGETHAGWTLQEVKAREVILQNEQKTAVLMLPPPPAK
jgi:hypothetical protein